MSSDNAAKDVTRSALLAGGADNFAKSANDTVRFRGFNVTTVAHMRYTTMPNPVDISAFEYFHSMALPILRLTPSFHLWNRPIGFLSQTSSAIRKIIVALGSQQRFLQERDSGKQHTRSLQERADQCYTNAVRALRQSIATRSIDGRPVIAFGCVLLILLASLRGSQEEMLIHLQSGVQIMSEKAERFDTSDEMRDIALLLHDYSVSSCLFCVSPLYRGECRSLAMNIMFKLAGWPDLHTSGDLWFELSGLIRETMHTFYTISITTEPSGDHMHNVYRLRSKNEKIQKALDDEPTQLQTEAARSDIMRASLMLSKVFLDAALLQTEPNTQEANRSFDKIVSLIASFLVNLNSSVLPRIDEHYTFLMGIGTIQMLDAVITRCPDQTIRDRALDVANLCPSREGMWVAQDAKVVWRSIFDAEDQGILPRPSTAHVYPEDEGKKVSTLQT